jgi:hypothetical protein
MDGNFFSVVAHAFDEARNAYNQSVANAAFRRKEANDEYRWNETFKLNKERLAYDAKQTEDDNNFRKFKLISDAFQKYQERQNKIEDDKILEGLRHTNRLDEIKAGRNPVDAMTANIVGSLSPQEQKDYIMGSRGNKQQPSYSDLQQDAEKYRTAKTGQLFMDAFGMLPKEKQGTINNNFEDFNVRPGSLQSFIKLRGYSEGLPNQTGYNAKVDSGITANNTAPKDLVDMWRNNPERSITQEEALAELRRRGIIK